MQLIEFKADIGSLNFQASESFSRPITMTKRSQMAEFTDRIGAWAKFRLASFFGQVFLYRQKPSPLKTIIFVN